MPFFNIIFKYVLPLVFLIPFILSFLLNYFLNIFDVKNGDIIAKWLMFANYLIITFVASKVSGWLVNYFWIQFVIALLVLLYSVYKTMAYNNKIIIDYLQKKFLHLSNKILLVYYLFLVFVGIAHNIYLYLL